MDDESLSPGVKGGDGAGEGAEVLGIGKEFFEGVPGGAEEEIGKEPAVEFPQGIEFGGDGEDGVVVIAVEEFSDLLVDPAGDLHEGADGTGAMFAGVIPHTLDVTVRTFLDVSAQARGAALADGLAGFAHAQGNLVRLTMGFEMVLQDFLDRRFHTRRITPGVYHLTIHGPESFRFLLEGSDDPFGRISGSSYSCNVSAEDRRVSEPYPPALCVRPAWARCK